MSPEYNEGPFMRSVLNKCIGIPKTAMGLALTLGDLIDSCHPSDGECTGYWSGVMRAAMESGALKNPDAAEFLLSKIRQYSA